TVVLALRNVPSIHNSNMRFAGGLLYILLASLPVSAQEISIHFGGKAGVPLTWTIPSSSNSFGQTTITPQGPRLTMAPTFTMFVDDRLAVDVEGLFRPVRYETDTINPSIGTFDKTRATALEIPVIMSYHFVSLGGFRPFVGAGLTPYEKAWGRIDAHSILH